MLMTLIPHKVCLLWNSLSVVQTVQQMATLSFALRPFLFLKPIVHSIRRPYKVFDIFLTSLRSGRAGCVTWRKSRFPGRSSLRHPDMTTSILQPDDRDGTNVGSHLYRLTQIATAYSACDAMQEHFEGLQTPGVAEHTA